MSESSTDASLGVAGLDVRTRETVRTDHLHGSSRGSSSEFACDFQATIHSEHLTAIWLLKKKVPRFRDFINALDAATKRGIEKIGYNV